MHPSLLTPVAAADAAAVTEIAVAVESSLYGPSTFSQGDLEEEWAGITAAFRLYERAGMTPALGWVAYEKTLGDESSGAA